MQKANDSSETDISSRNEGSTLHTQAAYLSYLIGGFLMFLTGTLPQTLHQNGSTAHTYSIIGTWKIYTMDAANNLHYSHFERYEANHHFTQWSAQFSVTGEWTYVNQDLCVKINQPAQTICGKAVFIEADTLLYIETGASTAEALVCIRQNAAAKPATASSPAKTVSPRPSTSSAPPTGKKNVGSSSKCVACSGTGHLYCTMCAGMGGTMQSTQRYNVMMNRYDSVMERVHCMACGGIGSRICAACGGSGKQK